MNGVRLWYLIALAGLSGVSSIAAPAILITNLPPYGSTSSLAGKVLGTDAATHAVAVLIYVPGYGWVSKPTCAKPLSPLQPDGTWQADITTGRSDTNATRIAALLVSTNFNQPCVDGQPNLSTNLYSQALASAVVTRPSPAVRWVSFAGYDWWVKNSTSPVGPGPNYFSDSTNNVWTDAQGWLHLRITHRANKWQCAELVSARTFGFGRYRFELNSAVDALDTNVTLGLFTWSDDPAYANREIDVEGGRWSNPADTNNAQFVVQPYNLTNHLVRYRVPPGLTNSTHVFVWETNRVSFQSLAGSYSPHPASSNIVSSYVFGEASTVPHSGDENVRLNLWLFRGNPPANGNEVEAIIKSFQFVPLGSAPPVSLRPPRYSASTSLQFEFSTWPDFHYQVQTTPDLVHWQDFPVLLATDNVLAFQDTNPPGAAPHFYRVEALP